MGREPEHHAAGAPDGDAQWKPPRGRHKLPEVVVSQNQRERLLAAAGRAMAEHGYPDLSVAHIIAEAEVSRSTFYKNFENKRDCVEAAHRAAFDQLMAAIFRACAVESEWAAKVAAGLDAAIGFAMSEPARARLLVLEAIASDQVLAARVLASDEHLIGLLSAGREHCPQAAWLPAITERAMVGGAIAIIGSRLLADEADRLPALRPQLLELILMPYVGAEEARRIAA